MFSFLKSFISQKRKKREMEKKGLVGSRKRRTQDATLGSAAEKSKFLGGLILALVWISCVAVLVLPRKQTPIRSLFSGQTANKTVYTEFDFSYEDEALTLEKKEAARLAVPMYYRVDKDITKTCLLNLQELYDDVEKRVSIERKGEIFTPDANSKVAQLVASLNGKVLAALIQIVQNTRRREAFTEDFKLALEDGIISSEEKFEPGQKIRIITSEKRNELSDVVYPEKAAEKITDSALRLYSPQNKKLLKQSMITLLKAVLSSNLVRDNKKLKEMQEQAVKLVAPAIVDIPKGTVIVRKDQTIDKRTLSQLKHYLKEEEKRKASVSFWQNLVYSSVVSLVLMILSGMYIAHIHPEVVKSNQKMWLIGTVMISAMFVNYGVIEIFNRFISPDMDIPPDAISKILPLALASILLSVMIGFRVAVYIGIFISIVASMMLGNSFDLLLKGVLVSSLAAFAVRHSTNYRNYIFRGVFAISLSLLVLLIPDFFKAGWDMNVPRSIIMLFVNGLVTSVLALVLLFVFEPLFQVSTDMSLLLLCDYNHPLLKRLQFEAPGTYHHSLMVSTLAEHAAQEIGASPIQARVGALFHDIGKLTKPEYFTENNMSGENKHEELHPRMSSLIILNHVKEGVDMALKYKLRKIIRDAIEEHHGTDLIFYFYKRALEENNGKDSPVEEQEYRYPGPLPVQKEVVLISLADACEAASRTLQKPSHAKVDALVWEIFRKRIRNGQLDEADLTFGELAKVRESFVKTLTTMLHGRIAYPKDEENENNEDDLFMAAKKLSSSGRESSGKPSGKDS